MTYALPHRQISDLLAPERSFLWLHRSVAALQRSEQPTQEATSATNELIGQIIGPDSLAEAFDCASEIISRIDFPFPALPGRFVSQVEEELLALGWAAQTLIDTAQWRAVAPTLFPRHDQVFAQNLSLLTYLCAERGMSLPQPMRITAAEGTRFPERPGLSGRPPRERALVQCLRVMIHADRHGACPVGAGRGFLSRLGLPPEIGDGIDCLLCLMREKTPKAVSVHPIHCPGLSSAEAALIYATAGPEIPNDSWLAGLGETALEPLGRLRKQVAVG